MKNGLHPWIAGQHEKRAALVIAIASIGLVALAIVWPWLMPAKQTATSPVAASEPPQLPIKVQAPAPAVKPVPKPEPEAPPAQPQPAPATVQPAKPPAPTKPAPAPTATKSAATVAGYYVQLGAFKDKKRAEALAGRLSGKWNTTVAGRPNNLHAVWVGPYKSESLAVQAKTRIAKAEKINGFIIKH